MKSDTPRAKGPQAASLAGRARVFYLLQSPGDICPLYEYCLVEAAYTRSVDVVLDLRRGNGSVLLSDRNIQRSLGLSYERIPREWESIRAQPRLVARLLESLASSWPSVLPFRMLIVFEAEDRWWVETACERCQASDLKIQVDQVDWGEGLGEAPCCRDCCPLLRRGEHHSEDLKGGPGAKRETTERFPPRQPVPGHPLLHRAPHRWRILEPPSVTPESRAACGCGPGDGASSAL